jgi:hypothetical protein
VTGGWKKLHRPNVEIHNFCASPYIIRNLKLRKIRWTGHVACIEKKLSAHKMFVVKPEGKRLLVRSRHVWEDNIKTYSCLRERVRENVDWIYVAQKREEWWTLVNMVMSFGFQERHGIFYYLALHLASQTLHC